MRRAAQKRTHLAKWLFIFGKPEAGAPILKERPGPRQQIGLPPNS